MEYEKIKLFINYSKHFFHLTHLALNHLVIKNSEGKTRRILVKRTISFSDKILMVYYLNSTKSKII